MDIHGKSVDMDIDMDGKFHIHGKPDKILDETTLLANLQANNKQYVYVF